MFNMLIHDKSFGSTPAFPNVHNSYAVDCVADKGKDSTPITHIWGWAAECSRRNGGINNLLIACHSGYVSKSEDHQESEGGFGINLGTGINLNTVDSMSALEGKVKKIFLYSCGAARVPDCNLLPSENKDMCGYFNNRLMVEKIAKITKCDVYASTSLQVVEIFSKNHGGFDFGAWEGKVELFKYIERVGVVTKNVTSGVRNFGEED